MRRTIPAGHLFAPFAIGRVELRNRIVMLPMTTGYAESDQSIGGRLIDYYAARAEGGVGLIIAPVSPSSAGSPVDAGLYDDRFIPGARRLTEAVHAHGAKISALLITCYHLILPANGTGCVRRRAADGTGRVRRRAADGVPPTPGDPEVVGPSAVMNTLLRVVPRELTVEEIGFIIDQYAKAAVRAERAGFDMVEIMAGGGYLVNRFLSPLSNTRTDEYGGTLERRTRFLVEIIDRVRTAVGREFPITVRLNLHENIEGGYTITEALRMARILEETGVSGFTSYIGRHESPVPTVQASVPKGAFVHLTEQLKHTVHVPVTASNRINDPFIAERILAEGRADLAGMGRALLADPGLPDKARTGRSDEIVPCLACSNCLATMLTSYRRWGEPASAVCAVNPAAGKERESTLRPALPSKRVFVVGGGPAGLEAARAAAVRGHDVTLYEKQDRLGGKLLIGCLPPHKEALGVLAASLATRALRAGVKAHVGQAVGRRAIEQQKPDVLVVAVGGIPRLPGIPGAGGANVVMAEDVLTGRRSVGGEVLVVGGGMVGCETAEYIRKAPPPGGSAGDPDALRAEVADAPGTGRDDGLRAGCDGPFRSDCDGRGGLVEGPVRRVTIVEMLERMAADVPVTSRPFFLARLKGEGIRMITGARVVEIGSRGVKVAKTAEGTDVTEWIPCDSVVLATGHRADNAAVAEFAGLVLETYVVGDCKDPRTIRDAIAEGFATGRSL